MERISELSEVEEIMQGELETENGTVLSTQLVTIEAWATRVAYLLYSAKLELDRKKQLALMPKSKEYTDVDRTINMEAMVATWQAKADYLESIQDNIRRRITLGQSILKRLGTEISSNVNVK